jgi:hypothetical protein
MGRLFNELKAPGYKEAVKRIFRLDEQEGVSSIGPEILPMVALESERPEWYALRGIWRFGSVPAVAAGGAGQFGAIQMPLPITATVIAIVEVARLLTPSLFCTARVNSTLRSGGTAANPLDRRAATGLTSQVRIVTVTAGATEGTAIDAANATNGGMNSNDEYIIVRNRFVISPGQSLTFWSETANITMQMALGWIEKPVTQDELGIVG